MLIFGADHGGFELKEYLLAQAKEAGHSVLDVGTHSKDSVDYPDIAEKVSQQVLHHSGALGVVVDGAGIGSSMAANKVPGILAAVCNCLYTAKNAREHNHANVLCLGSMVVGPGLAWQIVQTFLVTTPGPDRHERRVNKIRALEHRLGSSASVGQLVETITRIVMEQMGATPVPSPSRILPSPETPSVAKPVPTQPTTHWRPVLSERDVLDAPANQPLLLAPRTLVTPQARETAASRQIELRRVESHT